MILTINKVDGYSIAMYIDIGHSISEDKSKKRKKEIRKKSIS